MIVYVHKELPDDVDIIWKVNKDGFKSEAEANLVNVLRNDGCHYLSLVAETEENIVGHIFFTTVELTGDDNRLKIMCLAPMAVLKQYQNQGIGSKLVETGLNLCRTHGYDAVVVLGHPGYYPKFGFVPSVKFGIKSKYEVSDETFMILELVTGSLNNHQGIIKYHAAFNEF